MENDPGVSHQKLHIMIDSLSSLHTQSMKTPCLNRASMLLLGQSEKEQTCIVKHEVYRLPKQENCMALKIIYSSYIKL